MQLLYFNSMEGRLYKERTATLELLVKTCVQYMAGSGCLLVSCYKEVSIVQRLLVYCKHAVKDHVIVSACNQEVSITGSVRGSILYL